MTELLKMADDAQAVDNVSTNLEGGEFTIAFNPTFLTDGLGAREGESVQFQLTSSPMAGPPKSSCTSPRTASSW